MISQTALEEAKLAAMQRVWQSRRAPSSLGLLEEIVESEELLTLPRQNSHGAASKQKYSPSPTPNATLSCSDLEVEAEVWDNLQEQLLLKQPTRESPDVERPSHLYLDAASLGDFPARYTICPIESHQLPVVGVYVDKRVVPGFKYRVRPLPGIDQKKQEKCLFDDRALTLLSIGRGYARRFTFEADLNCLNDNENYFWSDNRPEGYVFELEVISNGDKFTIFDTNKEAQGTVEVLKTEGSQIEISNVVTKHHGVEKRANVRFTGKVEFFETGVAKPMPLAGVVISMKSRNRGTAEIVKVLNVVINRHRYTLVPGIQRIHRRVSVRGEDINDVPTKYTMNGLEPYEIPVVGTYVDARVIPGFHYKVRPNDRKDPLFGGRALKLISIGMGYAKRLTFQPDSLLEPDNYLWSDNHPDGLGLEPKAVHKGMQFVIDADRQLFGEATVFRADRPQREEKMERVMTLSGKCAIEKYIHIDVMCHIRLEIPGGGSTANEEHLMRVCGLAVVRKEPNGREANVIRVENVGLDSQLNVLFAQTHVELTFYPKNNY